jgi:hydrogenase small subunit
MLDHETLGERLAQQGISRRAFLKFCAAIASMAALPPGTATAIAEALIKAKRPSVIWLSFQECTGCTESLTPTLENMIFDMISLDYHHTLQAASGYGAEKSREDAMKEFYGKYLLLVDGSIPLKDGGVYSTIAGRSNLDLLQDAAKGAAASPRSAPARHSAASPMRSRIQPAPWRYRTSSKTNPSSISPVARPFLS